MKTAIVYVVGPRKTFAVHHREDHARVCELNYKSHIEYVTEMIMNISDSLRGWTAKSSMCNAQR